MIVFIGLNLEIQSFILVLGHNNQSWILSRFQKIQEDHAFPIPKECVHHFVC